MRPLRLSLYFFLALMFSAASFAQEDANDDEYVNANDEGQDKTREEGDYLITDEDYFSKKNKEQNRMFLDHETPFPARPKNAWEVSINLGGLAVQAYTPRGYVFPLGFMVGASVRKALGYVVSLRGEYQYRVSNTSELDFKQHAIFADAVFSLTNVTYHKEEIKSNIYLFSGLGVGFSDYAYSGFRVNGTTVTPTDFETDNTLGMLSAGIGFSSKINRFGIGAELRYAYAPYSTRPSFRENEEAYTNNFITLSAHLNIPLFLNKRTEALWWINPLRYAYSELNIPKHQKAFKVRFKDKDEDGVADDFDKEPNTRKGCPVNALGITLDTDKDGVPDCDDLEPITPTRCQPVNEDGIGKCPEPQYNNVNMNPDFTFDSTMQFYNNNGQKQTVNFPTKDSDGDGVPDLWDQQPNTPVKCPVDAKGMLLDTDKDGVPDCYDLEIITPSYCFPVDENGVGNCLPSNCCQGLKFKDTARYKDYIDKIKRQEKQLDSLSKKLLEGKELSKLKDRLDNNKKQGNVSVRDGRVHIDLNNDIFFKSGSAKVNAKAMSVLEEVAGIINKNEGFDVMVEGHTDNVPIRNDEYKDNWELSSARALNIVRLLVDKYGVKPGRLLSVGRGEFSPIADNNTKEGRRQNRRIEITMLPLKDK